jgi:hypothetical protein
MSVLPSEGLADVLRQLVDLARELDEGQDSNGASADKVGAGHPENGTVISRNRAFSDAGTSEVSNVKS